MVDLAWCLMGLSLGFGGEEVEANGMQRAVQRSPRRAKAGLALGTLVFRVGDLAFAFLVV
jgi:hypothetical protein